VAAEPKTGIITDEELTQATGTQNSDAAVAERFLAAEVRRAIPDSQPATDHPTSSSQWYGDSAYGTGELRDAIAGAGHVAVIKPKPLQAAVAGGFTVDDFTVDQAAGAVTCPNAITRPISQTGVATFGARCRSCPLRSRCTTSKTGRKLVVGAHDALLRQARRDWAADPTLREAYRRHRPNVERVISQLASRGGRRLRLRYLGVANNNAWLKRRTAALNLRNLIGRGLTRRDGTWALATT
jgi:Transposase DDE domain